MTALAFVLVFTPSSESDWIAYSQDVEKAYTSDFVLGPDYLPHATIVQFRGHQYDAEDIWKEAVTKGLTNPFDVIAAGLCFLPAQDNSEVWIEVPLLKSDDLASCQKSLLKLDALTGTDILNGYADAFRPHVTLGYTVSGNNLVTNCLALPGALLRRRLSVQVALADTGPNYSVPRILYI